MCYSNCPFEGNYSGECGNALKNSKNYDAHCNTDFECEVCGNITTEDNAGSENDICIDCEAQYKKDCEKELTAYIR